MDGLALKPAEVEEARIQAAYAKRLQTDVRYSWFNPGYLFIMQERERRLLTVLKQHGCTSLGTKKILDVGCGTGFWLGVFIKWGAQPENIIGVDLLPERVAKARQVCPAAVKVLCENAAQLPLPAATFDLVFQSMVFTSILDHGLKQQIASEMLRLVKREGFIVWYDFRVNNPRNPDVLGVKKREIARLFPGCQMTLRPITLAPPLIRLLAPYSWLTCDLLAKIPVLCTHYLGIIQKGETCADTISSIPPP